MSSLPRCGFSSVESHRQLLSSIKSKNAFLKQRNYSSSKLIKTLMLNSSKDQEIIKRDTCSEAIEGALEKNQLKRYCINRFRSGGHSEQIVLKRKNSSLKLFKKDDCRKLVEIPKQDQPKNQEPAQNKPEEVTNINHSKETISSQKSIPVKRRVEILKLSRNRPKLQIKDENFAKASAGADVSFELHLKDNHFQEEKIPSTEKIRSENVLGKGLKKCSSSKIKILVKNPFGHLKQQETAPHPSQFEEIPQIKESQILAHDDSMPSLQHTQDLQQLLAMM